MPSSASGSASLTSSQANKSWNGLWQEGKTPWDIGKSTPALRQFVEDGIIPRKGRVLVPGCGRGYDVISMASPERHTIGMDLSPVAIKEAESLRDSNGIKPSTAEFFSGDFFEYNPEEKFDLIYDYTFLCALPPEMRESWASKMFELLKDNGELLTMIFPVVEKEGGPPYAMSPELVKELVEPTGFKQKELYPCKNSVPEREGKEWVGRWIKPSRVD
eukprot:gb/GECH01004409.1/.p1 GENE.gb/GECH01004409.1/~~gb/GECH01004409.1/.p1  ORF type:complete len:217 (+),score=65.01 gb/GECH01004409.1/:1-651(+)